jgi:ABC-type polysaccharide/polyol phosphate export permease
MVEEQERPGELGPIGEVREFPGTHPDPVERPSMSAETGVETGPVLIRQAAGRLAAGGSFLREWLTDSRQSPQLGWRMFRRSIIQQSRHSLLGFLLFFAPAVMTALVFIYGRRAQFLSAEIGGVHSAFFSACGMLMGQTFLEAFNSLRRLLQSAGPLLRSRRGMLEPMLMASMIELGLRDVIRVIVIASLFVAFRVPVAATIPIAVWGLLGITLLGAGLGMFLAPLNALQRDIEVIASAFPLVLFTITPIFFLPHEGTWIYEIYRWNPLTWLFEGIRAAAYGAPGSVTVPLVAPLVGLVLFLLGWAFCRFAQPHVVERMMS